MVEMNVRGLVEMSVGERQRGRESEREKGENERRGWR